MRRKKVRAWIELRVGDKVKRLANLRVGDKVKVIVKSGAQRCTLKCERSFEVVADE